MKTISLLLSCFLALTVTGDEPSKPALFEVRLVRDSASTDTEQLPLSQQSSTPGQAGEERLHVQKKALLDRSALKSATVQKDPVTGAPEIHIVFKERGAKRFEEVTREYTGQRLAIVINGKIITAPIVRTVIPGGQGCNIGFLHRAGGRKSCEDA